MISNSIPARFIVMWPRGPNANFAMVTQKMNTIIIIITEPSDGLAEEE